MHLYRKTKRLEFAHLGQAVMYQLFTSAIPLLRNVEAFACCVSALGRYTSP